MSNIVRFAAVEVSEATADILEIDILGRDNEFELCKQESTSKRDRRFVNAIGCNERYLIVFWSKRWIEDLSRGTNWFARIFVPSLTSSLVY
jgi:hypothetical protein